MADDYVDIATPGRAVPDSPPRAAGASTTRSAGSPRNGHPYWLEPPPESDDEGQRRRHRDSHSPPSNDGGRGSRFRAFAELDNYADFRNVPSTPATFLNRLRAAVPYLSPEFTCSENDAEMLLNFTCTGARGMPLATSSGTEDKLAQLESDVRLLTQKLERRTDEVSRLKDEVADARGKQRAVEAQSKQSQSVLSQRREEVRKQLIAEESRNSKLQFQNKTLLQEVDKLKERLHQALSR